MGFGQTDVISSSIFPLISYMSLGKSLHFSESLSSPMKGIVTAPTL